MTALEKIEMVRKWGTTLATFLLIPMMLALGENFKLKMERDVAKNYLPISVHEAYIREHKDWSQQQVRDLEEDTKSVAEQQVKASRDAETKFIAISAKLDALGLDINTLRIQVGTLEKTIERRTP